MLLAEEAERLAEIVPVAGLDRLGHPLPDPGEFAAGAGQRDPELQQHGFGPVAVGRSRDLVVDPAVGIRRRRHAGSRQPAKRFAGNAHRG